MKRYFLFISALLAATLPVAAQQPLYIVNGVETEQIASILIAEFGAHWVRVKVVKPRKFDDVDAVGVQIERRAPSRDAPRTADMRSPLVRAAGIEPAQALRPYGF